MRTGRRQIGIVDGVELLGLSAIAVAQPLLDLIAHHAQFLVAHRATPGEILLLLAALLVGLPAAAWLIEAAAARVGLGRALHLLLVALLVAAAALPALERIARVPGGVLAVTSLVLGAGAALAHARFRAVRTFATALGVAPLVFAGSFVFDGSIAKLLFPSPVARSDSTAVEAEAPVVMVVFDELPTISLLDENERIDAIRYPAFAELARHATWFRNASAVDTRTQFAVPAILTGRYPDPARLAIASDHPHSLFTLLAGRYQMNVSETSTRLFQQLGGRASAPERGLERLSSILLDLVIVYLHWLLPDDLAAPLPPVTMTWTGFARGPADELRDDTSAVGISRPKRFRRFVASITPSGGPTLHFLHSLLPHRPWSHLPSGRVYLPANDLGFRWSTKSWGPHEWWVVQGYQRHLLQLGHADALLGELLARLEALDLYDRSLIIVTADHGGSFWPNRSFRDPSMMKNPEDTLGVPLLIKAPHQRGGRVSFRNVESIDILPTVADLLGLRLPWPVDGCSAVDPSCPERAEKIMYSRKRVPRRFDPAVVRRRDSLDRKLRLFGSGSRRIEAPSVERYRNLLGRRVDEIGVAGAAPGRAELDRRGFQVAAISSQRIAPAYVWGWLAPESQWNETPHLAIAVRGAVRAVVPGLRTRYRGRWHLMFGTLLPEESIPARIREIEVFAIEGPADAPRLLSVETRLSDG